LGVFGEVGGSVAASNGPNGSGTLYRIYASRVSRSWSLSFSYQSSSHDFAQLGEGHGVDRPREILQATVGANSRRLGSFTANISYLRMQDGTRTRVSSINYNRQISKFAYFNGFVLRTDTTDSGVGTTIGASLSIPLGTRRSAYVQADSDSRHLEVQQTRPDDKGWGYRVAVSQGETDQQEGELDYRGRAIDLTADISRFNGQVAERVLASGGFVWSGTSILPTRRLNDSFAIVDVGGGERGVRVYQENRQVATTNGAGIAIVTDLRPYEANRLSVAPDDLKMESTIHNDNLIVVPRFLAGVRARFQITSGHAGTVLIVLPDGSPLEAGLALSSEGEGTFYSGFDGEVFVDNISEGKVLVAKRDSGPCRVTLPAVPKGVELPRIGPLTCQPLVPAK
jgi:outer membrane usher protein